MARSNARGPPMNYCHVYIRGPLLHFHQGQLDLIPVCPSPLLNTNEYLTRRQTAQSLCADTMRYENWDILLFPRDCKVPIKEFKVACHVVYDSGTVPYRAVGGC